MSGKKLVSLIVPCFNEEKGIQNTYQTIINFWEENCNQYDLELILIDDGSKDKTFEVISEIAKQDKRVKVVQFSRNFGKEIATSAGIEKCSGQACIMFDADLQYPIESLLEFLEKWENGAEVVIGIRDKKQTNNFIEKIGSYWFYKILRWISDLDFTAGALDYRLLDRVVIQEFVKFTERGRMTRALIDWLGFTRDYVYYEEKPRVLGESNFSLRKRIHLAISTYIATSLFPLKLAGYLGVLICSLTFIILSFLIVNQYVLNNPLHLVVSGTAFVVLIVLFLTGVNLVCLGLIALYIANIHTEVTNKPMYVVRKKLNF